jgi:hypothetical protein
MTETLQLAARAVVNVGSGRGFIVEVRDVRYVISAGHCLPRIPQPTMLSDLDERTYLNIIGRLEGPQDVAGELLFLDVMGDVAVFGEPDSQELGMLAEGYRGVVESGPAFRIGDMGRTAPVWLLGLSNRWSRGTAQTISAGGRILLSAVTGGIVRKMSGSPIIAADGRAIGIVSCNDWANTAGEADLVSQTGSGPQARLLRDLPGWLVRSLS